MIFLYLTSQGVMISDAPPKIFLKQHRKSELLRQFKKIQDCREHCRKMNIVVMSDIKKQYTGVTPEGRERMREKKRGTRNPNAGGLSWQHKWNISQVKKRTNHGEFHPMYGRKHRTSSKLQTSWALKKLPKRRWAVDVLGKEHFIFAHSTLPPGWAWGRSRGSNRRW
jgi:hypothetical protein